MAGLEVSGHTADPRGEIYVFKGKYKNETNKFPSALGVEMATRLLSTRRPTTR